MKQVALLSVVVPVFNGGKFLPRCLDCLLNQSLKDIEIIVIDDGSTDDTSIILSHYKKNYDNLRIITQPYNMGTGIARNIGLSETLSPLIAFLDVDDWLDTNAYINLTTAFNSLDIDIAVCGIKTENSNATCSIDRYTYIHNNVIAGIFALKLLSRTEQQDVFISPIVGNKVFRTSFLRENSLAFPDRSVYEDDEFMFLCFCHAKKVALISNTYHHYFQHGSSISHMFSSKYADCLLVAFNNIRNHLNEENLTSCYRKEFYAFFDKCLASFFDTLFLCIQDVSMQRKEITYLLETILKYFSVQEIIDNIEPCRLQRLWL